VRFQQRQSEARAQLVEDNEIETTGKARETTGLCATRRKGFVKRMLDSYYVYEQHMRRGRKSARKPRKGIRKLELVEKK